MITKDTLPQLLTVLGFIKRASTYSKTIGEASLEIDTAKGIITYPEAQGLVVNERQTCNFSANENFVVFECVHRLLEKGYKAEHIELEPKWKLGHGASGGRADILIKDNSGKALLIIECKTLGREFDKAWRNTLQDGGQLFSYAQQISETQFLCLYTSGFENGAVNYQSHIIAHRDNEKYLADNPTFKGFKAVTDVKERFAVWRNTYKLDYTTKGIFETNIQPYHIGKDKYTIADLQSISADDQQKKYHEFATILRQHNVSGRENAFDKLVNLFLCKLVDETENPHELKFYWKGVAYDTHFDLLDRLQQLYQGGMKKFLGEEITYISKEDVSNRLRFIRQNPDATQRAVWNLFEQQKYFTNNDFSFIDVHNEKLFYQNAEVMLKILQMWQDIRLIGDHKHNQFLGDMFEGFLDQGVKQSEGQFFTPMPICRFILTSLPLESLIRDHPTPPKAIDYACGAGHFLNELAQQIKPLVTKYKHGDMTDYHKAIFGMEKEYRLSKVAKVSAFMYGQQEINICYGDALIHQHAAFPQIQNNSFDLLVANPPYSVRGFLETLPEEERAFYTLSSTIDKLDTNNSIETFFIERAKQLLKAGGIAALILPSSILSNGGNTYIKTREILLQFFDIVAIAEFGSGTFGKTGTNTVTLFLRRKATAPDTAEHYRERVEQWFSADDNQPIYQDGHLIGQYATHIGVAVDDYKTLLAGQPNGALLAHETFVQYRKAYDGSTEIANLKRQMGFRAKSQSEQEAELEKRFLTFVQAIEHDKLYHFVLASQQPNPVLIIKSPSDTKLQKQFLGYDWSSAKGDEGIKLIKDARGHHLTPLYDETNRDNAEKLNSYIADNFDGKLAAIPPALSEYATTARLVDMLDFSRVTFEKQISLTIKTTGVIQSKWPLEKLGDKVNVLIGGTPPRDMPAYFTGQNLWVSIAEMTGQTIRDTKEKITDEAIKKSNVKLIPAGTTLLSFKLSIGKTAIAGVPLYTNEAIAGLIPKDKNEICDAYLFHLFNAKQIDLDNTGYKAFGKSLNSTFLKEEIKIPIPPLGIQQQIVTECEAADAEAATAQASIDTSRQSIENAISKAFNGSHLWKKVGDASVSLINPSKSEIRAVNDDTLVTFVEMAAVSEEGFISNPTNKPLKELRKGSYTYFAENDIILAKITPCMENGKCALAKGLTNGFGMGSSEFHVVRANQDHLLPDYLFALLNRKVVREAAEKVMTGASGHRRVPVSFYENLKIPVPPLAEQKRLVAQIETFEKIIADAQAIIAAAPAKKQAIMQRYL